MRLSVEARLAPGGGWVYVGRLMQQSRRTHLRRLMQDSSLVSCSPCLALDSSPFGQHLGNAWSCKQGQLRLAYKGLRLAGVPLVSRPIQAHLATALGHLSKGS
jgi:hypothetical protein